MTNLHISLGSKCKSNYFWAVTNIFCLWSLNHVGPTHAATKADTKQLWTSSSHNTSRWLVLSFIGPQRLQMLPTAELWRVAHLLVFCVCLPLGIQAVITGRQQQTVLTHQSRACLGKLQKGRADARASRGIESDEFPPVLRVGRKIIGKDLRATSFDILWKLCALQQNVI